VVTVHGGLDWDTAAHFTGNWPWCAGQRIRHCWSWIYPGSLLRLF
jgi:hypothetical protein